MYRAEGGRRGIHLMGAHLLVRSAVRSAVRGVATAEITRDNSPAPTPRCVLCVEGPRVGGAVMGIEDVVNQGKEFLEQNKAKIDEVIKSDKAEEVSDSVLDAAADFIKKVAPDSVDAHVDGVRDNIDKAVGNE